MGFKGYVVIVALHSIIWRVRLRWGFGLVYLIIIIGGRVIIVCMR